MARQDASHLFGDEHVRTYRETGGELGHDWKEGTSILLLTTKGRKSGEQRTTPLIYGTAGDDYVIVASKGGSDEPPGWYVNLEADPEVEVQVLDDTLHRPRPHRDAGREAGAVGADGRRVAALRRLPGEHRPRDPGRGARAPLKSTIVSPMLTFADIALETTIVYILIWGILFPAFVTGLIAYAFVVGRGEGQENEENRRFSRRL